MFLASRILTHRTWLIRCISFYKPIPYTQRPSKQKSQVRLVSMLIPQQSFEFSLLTQLGSFLRLLQTWNHNLFKVITNQFDSHFIQKLKMNQECVFLDLFPKIFFFKLELKQFLPRFSLVKGSSFTKFFTKFIILRITYFKFLLIFLPQVIGAIFFFFTISVFVLFIFILIFYFFILILLFLVFLFIFLILLNFYFQLPMTVSGGSANGLAAYSRI